jgi:hypothetical protein
LVAFKGRPSCQAELRNGIDDNETNTIWSGSPIAPQLTQNSSREEKGAGKLAADHVSSSVYKANLYDGSART